MKARIIGTIVLLVVLAIVADLAGMFDGEPIGQRATPSYSAPPPSATDNDMKGLKIN